MERLNNHKIEFLKKRKNINMDLENHKFRFFTKLTNCPNLGIEFTIYNG